MAFMLIHLLDLQTNSPCEASPLCFSVFKIYVTWQSNTTYFFVLDCHITYILNFKQTLFFNLDAHKSSLLSGIIVQEKFDIHRAVHCNIISIVKPTRCTNVSNLFYFGMTLYVFRTVFPSIVHACCCMYSLELLTMDGKTIRNMYSVIPK